MSTHFAALPVPRHVPNLESHLVAQARARMFPLPHHDYLKSALTAAVTLKTATPDYLERMDNRTYHERVRDINVEAFYASRRALTPSPSGAIKKPWYLLW